MLGLRTIFSCSLVSPLTRLTSFSTVDVTLKQRIMKKLGILNHSRADLKINAYLMYEGMVDKINYKLFLEDCKMPDTFYSWFAVTQLHVWMLLVRAMAAGDDGRFLRNMIVEAMWSDVEHRSKKLDASSQARREQVSELPDQFQAALLSYDEGLASSDIVLASALWRTLFQKQDVSAHALEAAVHLIRKQVQLLDAIDNETFILNGRKVVAWHSLPIPSSLSS